MKKLLGTICMTCSIILSCSKNQYSKQTKELKAYLKDNFNTAFKDKAIYLIIPSCQCKYCIKLDGGKLISEAAKDRFILITSLDTVNFTNFKNVIYDAEDKNMKLSFLHYANQLVFVEDSEIIGIDKLTDFNRQIDSVQRQFLK